MYTAEEQKILDYTIQKVRNLFETYPAPSHSFDHAEVVAHFAEQIATQENAHSIFMCVLAAYVHDIGRAAEHHTLGFSADPGSRHHHELSYQMLQTWLQESSPLAELSAVQKNELLYSVRNHWNNFADKYDSAWILRDADKLDCFGERGIARNIEASNGDENKLSQILRNNFDIYYWFKTATARQILAEQNMMEPLLNFYKKFLLDRIQEVVDYEE